MIERPPISEEAKEAEKQLYALLEKPEVKALRDIVRPWHGNLIYYHMIEPKVFL